MTKRKKSGAIDVLITGAAGFIGGRLMKKLQSEGMTVIGADLHASNGIVAMDITSAHAVRDAFAEYRPKRVVHLAAIVDDRGDPALFEAVNVEGTRHVIEAALDHPLERFVQVSSIVALGFDPGRGAGGHSPLVTTTGSPYFDTKARSERLVRDLRDRDGAPVVVVRPGDVYGPGSEPWVIRPLEMMRKHLPVLVAGGRGLMAHCWVDNLVDGLALALVHEDASGGIFQIHDGVNDTTYKHYFTSLAAVAGAPKPRLSMPGGVALVLGKIFDELARRTSLSPPFSEAAVRFLARRATYCMKNTRQTLGYEPRVSLEEGLERLRRSL